LEGSQVACLSFLLYLRNYCSESELIFDFHHPETTWQWINGPYLHTANPKRGSNSYKKHQIHKEQPEKRPEWVTKELGISNKRVLFK